MSCVVVVAACEALMLCCLEVLGAGLIHCSVCLGVKPYACSMCDMRFIQRNHLERHSLTHTGMRSFTVPLPMRKALALSTHRGHNKLEFGLSSHLMGC